jgi:hypothetical protein
MCLYNTFLGVFPATYMSVIQVLRIFHFHRFVIKETPSFCVTWYMKRGAQTSLCSALILLSTRDGFTLTRRNRNTQITITICCTDIIPCIQTEALEMPIGSVISFAVNLVFEDSDRILYLESFLMVCILCFKPHVHLNALQSEPSLSIHISYRRDKSRKKALMVFCSMLHRVHKSIPPHPYTF